jgi:hypothetical protein
VEGVVSGSSRLDSATRRNKIEIRKEPNLLLFGPQVLAGELPDEISQIGRASIGTLRIMLQTFF